MPIKCEFPNHLPPNPLIINTETTIITSEAQMKVLSKEKRKDYASNESIAGMKLGKGGAPLTVGYSNMAEKVQAPCSHPHISGPCLIKVYAWASTQNKAMTKHTQCCKFRA